VSVCSVAVRFLWGVCVYVLWLPVVWTRRENLCQVWEAGIVWGVESLSEVRCLRCVIGLVVFEESVCVSCQWSLWLPVFVGLCGVWWWLSFVFVCVCAV